MLGFETKAEIWGEAGVEVQRLSYLPPFPHVTQSRISMLLHPCILLVPPHPLQDGLDPTGLSNLHLNVDIIRTHVPQSLTSRLLYLCIPLVPPHPLQDGLDPAGLSDLHFVVIIHTQVR